MGQDYNKPKQIKPDPRMVALSIAAYREGRYLTTEQYLAKLRKK